MRTSSEFQFDDIQGLVRYGHGKLRESCFLLLNIIDVDAAKQWLNTAPVTNARQTKTAPNTALQIAFSVHGLRILGVNELFIQDFSDEFIIGMSGDDSRSRRLGDVGSNSPESWEWGGDAARVPHVMLLLYAKTDDDLDSWRKSIVNDQFLKAFQILKQLPTNNVVDSEPFGFKDGISQPVIDWQQQQTTDQHQRERYSNLMSVGEVVLGYPNEYGLYTERPLINPEHDGLATELADAEDKPELKDFARNGSYLVIRQLAQDVPGFWQFLDEASNSEPEREQLAAAMVGRKRDGTPLVARTTEPIPGIPTTDPVNHFTYDFDSKGNHCPIGAHIRRSNPRTGDLPPRITGWISRLMKKLGFGKDPNEDLVASTRFHRLLRRGRAYGPALDPEEAIKPKAEVAERGLQFICLSANILRQFEFVQNAWTMSTQFNGLRLETDPLLGNRETLKSGQATDVFSRPDPTGPTRKTCHLPQFVTVRGGGYFFLPGLRAIKYIASIPAPGVIDHD